MSDRGKDSQVREANGKQMVVAKVKGEWGNTEKNKTIKVVGQGAGSAAAKPSLGFVQDLLGLGVQLSSVPMPPGHPNPSPSVQRAFDISGIVEWQGLHGR